MIITVLQILFVLGLIVLIIWFVLHPKRTETITLPENYRETLADYLTFYAHLNAEEQDKFDSRLQKFLSGVKITGANAQVEDIDRLLIGAAAIIPVYFIPDWEYINLREILLYPGNFNTDFDQHGSDRTVSGMIGTGNLDNVMILSKWELRQGFINSNNNRNTAIHEFVHLVDKMDGTLDGVPELLLERKYVPKWQELLQETMAQIRRGGSDIDTYGATSPAECFAVIAEYFFTQPQRFQAVHPQLASMMERIFVRK